jgi:hypothetical protein
MYDRLAAVRAEADCKRELAEVRLHKKPRGNDLELSPEELDDSFYNRGPLHPNPNKNNIRGAELLDRERKNDSI